MTLLRRRVLPRDVGPLIRLEPRERQRGLVAPNAVTLA